ncbi:MAG: acyl-[acyl-carrier-protein]-phospholipid O-acyltransferase [Flavobacteriales bacterium]|jgi:acyl-[acyl-carrier-protein]-phospholipid O-acyltransferase/long-chain-fatty-acid--[acyl-carrier-protein] ligase
MLDIIKVKGMSAFLLIVFLNAFVDLGHKIVIQNTIFKIYDGSEQIVLAAFVNAMILLPFIMFFVPSANTSTHFSKNTVMRLASLATIGLTLGITLCYYNGWFKAAFVLTFLLAVESAFFSPAKSGYIKFLVGKERLAPANGFAASMAIFAILAGTFVYSILFEMRFDKYGAENEAQILKAIAPLGWVLVSNALVQTIFAWTLPTLENGNTDAKISWLSISAFKRAFSPVIKKPTIRYSIVGLTVFWSVSQVMIAAFPAYAKETLGITNTVIIQGAVACSGIGIMLGALFAGQISKRYIELGLVPVSAIGLTIGLFLLPNLTSMPLVIANFLFIGFMGGILIVPLNSLIQYFSTDDELGNSLAANNLMQNIGMVSFLSLTVIFAVNGIPTDTLLSLLGVVTFIGAIFAIVNFPHFLLRFVILYLLRHRYSVAVNGFGNIPERGGVLMLGNHISWFDWGFIQIAAPRPVRFVMERHLHDKWYLNWFFKLYGVIPIEPNVTAVASLKAVGQLLQQGEVVCLFPEGGLTRSGELTKFRSGFEIACRQVTAETVVILPFYIKGLWGSRFSRSEHRGKELAGGLARRKLEVAFGKPINKDSTAEEVKQLVYQLSQQTD